MTRIACLSYRTGFVERLEDATRLPAITIEAVNLPEAFRELSRVVVPIGLERLKGVGPSGHDPLRSVAAAAAPRFGPRAGA